MGTTTNLTTGRSLRRAPDLSGFEKVVEAWLQREGLEGCRAHFLECRRGLICHLYVGCTFLRPQRSPWSWSSAVVETPEQLRQALDVLSACWRARCTPRPNGCG
jgi:hypothetical protein